MNEQPFGCVNNTIRLRSGKYLDLADPKPDQFDFADIAGALSKICRFGGQCDFFYSVAEHSYHCAIEAKRRELNYETQLAVLLHDAAEAFIGDVVKPLKIMLPEYAVIEQRMEVAIAEKFYIDFAEAADSIRTIDHAMLIAERRAMFSRDTVKWHGEDEVERLDVKFMRWFPIDAEMMFVCRAREIGMDISDACEVLLR